MTFVYVNKRKPTILFKTVVIASAAVELVLDVCLLALEFTLGVCLLACLPGVGDGNLHSLSSRPKEFTLSEVEWVAERRDLFKIIAILNAVKNLNPNSKS